MFGFRKSQMGFKTGRREETAAYDGVGIWYRCKGCEAIHKVDETAAFRDFVEEQCEIVGDSSQRTYEEFRIGEPNGRWDVVPEQARFIFTRENGCKCHARYGIIGSYNPETHSWMWAWNFPEDWMPEPALKLANDLYDFGHQRKWQVLTEPMLYLDDHEAWHMTKLAAHVAGYPMVYRAPVNDINTHYFAIDRPVWLT